MEKLILKCETRLIADVVNDVGVDTTERLDYIAGVIDLTIMLMDEIGKEYGE